MKPAYPVTRKRNFTSHFIGIPLDANKSAVGVVLWQSKVFTNVIALGITSERLPHGTYPHKIETLQSVIDTGANIIRAGYWHVGPKIDITIPNEISMRIIGSEIYCNDEPLRKSSKTDKSQVPQLGAAGIDYVTDYIRFLDTGVPDSKAFLKNSVVMGAHLAQYPVLP